VVNLSAVPLPARALGLAGLIPFAACAAAVWMTHPEIQLEGLRLQLGYAAVILTFLGGVHWGRALAGDGLSDVAWGTLSWSVTPSLIAWVALWLPPVPALIIFIASFALAFFIDRRAIQAGFLPSWYLELRKVLTLGAMLCLAATLARFFATVPA